MFILTNKKVYSLKKFGLSQARFQYKNNQLCLSTQFLSEDFANPNVSILFYSCVGQLHQKFGREWKIWIFITKWSCLKAQKEE